VVYPKYSNNLYQNLPLCKKRIFELAAEKLNKTKEVVIIQTLKEYIQFLSERWVVYFKESLLHYV